MSRKPNGKVAAEKYSVRLEPEASIWIVKKYGGLREALESLLPKSKKPKKKVQDERF